MKSIVLFGSTGMIGQRILAEASSRGHMITAVVRETSRTGEHRANLSYRTGDIFKPEQIAAAAVGHDVVVSAYGPGIGDADLIVKAAHSLIDGLTRVEPIRLIAVSGAGSLEVKPGVRLEDTPDFPAAWKLVALAHTEALKVFREAGFAEFDWTAVSPSAVIEPGTRTGKYRTATDQLIVDARGNSRISAVDFGVGIVVGITNQH